MLKAGIVGCGRIASGFDDDPKRKVVWTHAGAYKNVEGIELVALCDIDKDKLETCGKKWTVERLYTNYNEMLEKENLDIVSICTWTSTHYEVLKSAVKSKVKAIFCEKPIAANLKQADEMIKLCKDDNIILMIDYPRRFDGFHSKIKQFIDGDNIGKIKQANFYYTAGIANSGSHMFDLMNFLFGDVDWVQAHYNTKNDDPNIDGLVKFKKGFICTVQSLNSKYYRRFNLHIYGTKGAIETDGFGLEVYKAKPSHRWSEYNELYKIDSPIKWVEESHMINGIKHLIDCIKNNKIPVSTGEDARESLELICAFHESAMRDGKKINLPLKTSNIEIKSK